MGLKKIFPVIFVLITLSLIGSIYIQVNWIFTMLQNKQEVLKHKLIDATSYVAQELVMQRGSTTGKVLRLKPGLLRPMDPFQMELMRVPTVAERYTVEDIADKMRKAFNLVGMKDTRFEFSVRSDPGGGGLNLQPLELRSRNFLREIEDTSNNLSAVMPLQAPENADV